MGDDYRIQDLRALLDDPVSLMERAIALLRGEAVPGRTRLHEMVLGLPEGASGLGPEDAAANGPVGDLPKHTYEP